MESTRELTRTSASASTAGRGQKPEPDAARIIASFADVERDYRAPVTDDAICACPHRSWVKYDVRLVPFGYAPLQDLDSSGLSGALEAARRGEIFLVAMSHPDFGGLFGVMTLPRPREPWYALKLTEEKWYTRGNRPPSQFGFDQNVACELRFCCLQFLIRDQAPICARPRPLLAIDELERRYGAIRADASEPLMIDRVDVSTWARFLERARNAAHLAGRSRAREGFGLSAEGRVVELALEAWPIRLGD